MARLVRFTFMPVVTARYRVLPTSRIRTITEMERTESIFLTLIKHGHDRSPSGSDIKRRVQREAFALCIGDHPKARQYLRRTLTTAPSAVRLSL